VKIAFYIAIALTLVFSIAFFLTGDGGLEKMTTLSGIYAVENPSGYKVVCFVERGSGAMSCLKDVQK